MAAPAKVRDLSVNPAVERESRAGWLQERDLELLEAIAVMAIAPLSLERALRDSMRRLRDHGDWDVGHVWLRGPLDWGASPNHWDTDDPERYEELVRGSPPDLPDREGTLPERAIRAREPIWLESLSEDPRFVRRVAPSELGLVSAVAIPLLARDQAVGVVELFSSGRRPPDPRLLGVFRFVAATLGRAAEHHLARQDLERSEARLRQVLATAHDAYVAMDGEGTITEWNARAEALFGWSREEAIGRPVAETLVPEEYREAHREGLSRFLRTGEGRVIGRRVRFPALCRDGSRLPVEITISPLEVEEGVVFSAFLHDVSEEERQEGERQRREEMLSEAQRIARLGSWEWDIVEDRVTWSDELYGIFGLEPGPPLTYETYLGRLSEEDSEVARAAVGEALETGQPFSFEHGVTRPDGTKRVVLGSGGVIVDEEGKPVRMYGTAQDITEQRAHQERRLELQMERAARAQAEALEREARRSEARYRELADSIPQHVWRARPDGTLEYLNSVGREYLGLDVDALNETRGEGWVHPDDLPHNLAAWDEAFASGKRFETHIRLRRADGVYRWHLVRAEPRSDAEGRVETWFGTSTDVHDQAEAETARDRALEALARANEALAAERTRLERTNEELDQFAYVASHDLRAPLRGIGNLVGFLEEDLSDSLSGEAREMMDLLVARVSRMEALIDGILAYSRAGRETLEPEQVDVSDVVRELVAMLEVPEGTEIEVEASLPEIFTPRVPLERVFQNLVSNAVKFAGGPGGRIRIGGRPLGSGGWEFRIEDNGPGIAEEFRDRVWQIFQTLQSRDEVEGTGIGLAVVKRIVESRGGRIELESAAGAGATFRFTWPAESGAAGEEPEETAGTV